MGATVVIYFVVWCGVALLAGTMLGRFIEVGAGGPNPEPAVSKARPRVAEWPRETRRAA